MAEIKTIIFDLDGTLVDTSRDITAAINYVRSQLALPPFSVNEVIRHVGHGVTHLMENTITEDTEMTTEELRQMIVDYYSKHLLDQTTVYPGIYALLEALADKYNLAIASNKPVELSRQTVRGLGMENVFSLVVGPETTGKGKPDPDMLAHVAYKFESEPNQTVMIGDSPVDIEAARNFGCAIYAVSWGYNLAETLHGAKPDQILHEPLDLLLYL